MTKSIPVSPARFGKTYVLLSLVIVIISLALYLWKFGMFPLGTYMDDAQYVVLAKSIAEHRDYGLINFPNSILPTRYPFGWPLILAPVYILFDGSFQALQMVSLAFTIANTLLILVFWRLLGLPNRFYGLAVAALYAVSPMVVGHAGMVMSEPAFLFFVLSALILTTRLTLDQESPIGTPIILGIVWMFATYVRTIGLSLVFATVIYLIWRRKWQALSLAVVGLVLASFLTILITSISWHDLINVTEYNNQFQRPDAWGQAGVARDIFPRIMQGIQDYLGSYLRDTLVPFIGGATTGGFLSRFSLGFAPAVASALVSFLVVLGYVVTVRRPQIHPVHVYLPIYMAITIVWPWKGERFLYGVLPFLYGFLLLGGHTVLQAATKVLSSDPRSSRWIHGIAITFVGLLLCAEILRSGLIDNSLNHVRDLSIGAFWIRDNTPVKAIVVAEQPEAVFLYAKRSAVGLPDHESELQVYAPRSPVYVLIAPELKWRNDGILEYSDNTRQFLESLQLGKARDPELSLVFEDRAAKVMVFQLDGEVAR